MKHRAIELNNLVGKRFKYLKDISSQLKENNTIIKSESERLQGLDFILDGEYLDETPFSIYYLVDNNNLLYITEVNF